MKKIIKYFLLIVLICFSFFYTENVIDMVNKNDPLMKRIVESKFNYEVTPVNALIEEDTIVPGVKGKILDVKKSYNNMKNGGIFRESAIVYKDLYPYESIKNNIDKYIVKGNGVKKNVSLLYILNSNYIDDVSKIENITIFVNSKELNMNNIKILKEKEIYSYGNNGIYSDEILISDNALINKLSSNKSKYCLVKSKNKDTLGVCNRNGMHVVIPNIIGNYYNIKNNLSNGSIILLENLNEIEIIINYIKSKGFNIVSLSNLLNE